MKQHTPFEELLAKLATDEVRFITVGGVACALCGYVRTTEDVDIIVDDNPENIHRLLETLKGFGEGHAGELSAEDFDDEEGAIRIVEEFPLDVFTRMSGHSFNDLVGYSRQHVLDNIEIPYLGVDGLILLKRNSRREKDRMDVAALRQLSEETR